MPPYSLNHTVCSCRLQCDLSIVYTADIPVSRECQELNTSRISVWVYVNHFIWFLFPLLYSFTFFHLCLVCCGQKWCICLWLFPSLALSSFENFAAVWEQTCMKNHSSIKSHSSFTCFHSAAQLLPFSLCGQSLLFRGLHRGPGLVRDRWDKTLNWVNHLIRWGLKLLNSIRNRELSAVIWEW